MTGGFEQPRIFTDIWAAPDSDRLRLRVNDDEISTHPEFGSRWETSENGLTTIDVQDEILKINRAEISLELWGGHPHTTLKKFSINGRRQYCLPRDGTAEGHCAYTFPTIPIDVRDLLKGENAIQFSCNKGTGFWGHFIVDNLKLRLYRTEDDPVFASSRKIAGSVTVKFKRNETDGPASNAFLIGIEGPDDALNRIKSAEFFGRYSGYDAHGGFNPIDSGWKGYTRDRITAHHLGTATEDSLAVEWTDADIPVQPAGIAVCAKVILDDGNSFYTPLALLDSPSGLGNSRIHGITDMPVPFWSRDGREKTASIQLPRERKVRRAVLHCRVWDGADFEGTSPVAFNCNPVDILDGQARHDYVYVRHELDPGEIRDGRNTFSVLSKTEHHGLEVLLPGPALQIWYDE